MNIIRSAILSQFPNLLCGMSMRDNGIQFSLNMSFNVGDETKNVKENRKEYFAALGIDEDRVAFPLQEHTNNVHITSIPDHFPHCDALVTMQKNLFIAISVADCTPVMLFDPVRNVVAGIHAGWRGTANMIVHNAVQMMAKQFATDPRDIYAFIGPSAGGCCYEVGSEVAALFPEECRNKKRDGKFLLDVKRANALQLLANGVQESHIEMHSDCSIHNHQYHSFRRDGKNSGRMLAIIGMK